jgi:hypothetical protein
MVNALLTASLPMLREPCTVCLAGWETEEGEGMLGGTDRKVRGAAMDISTVMVGLSRIRIAVCFRFGAV